MSGEILFLAHRVPFPPDRGDKIRSHHILHALARLAPVHVGCLAEGEDDLAQEPQLAALAASHWMPTRAKPLPIAGLQAMASGRPVSECAFGDSSLSRWVEGVLKARPICAVYLYSGQMGQYLPASWRGRVIADLVDVDSAKFEAYAQQRRGPMRWLLAREGRLLRAMESRLAARATHTLLVSAEEAALLRSRISGGGDVRVLRNGIDCAHFHPEAVAPEPRLQATGGPNLLFTGQMDYPPNVAAVQRFARDILPAIRERHAGACFHIVGRAPAPAVERLAAEPGVKVWGQVSDMRPFLAAADLVVAPLTIARGVQNKVLEAMAMARTVLASPEAATGIGADPGVHLLVCPGNRAFVEQALELLAFPARAALIGQAARQFVCAKLSWPATLAGLPGLLGLEAGASTECRDAA